MKIAVDAMGGDHAPGNLVEGVRLALEAFPKIERIFLVGDQERLKALVDAKGMRGPRLEIVHASQVVAMCDSAALSVRRKRDSSIAVAVDLVKQGACEAVVSAGHTGASVAASTVKLRLLPGVDRPGICSPLPNDHGICNILDAGANVDAKARHLLHYGIMGTVYARHILGQKEPRVGLMSVGQEDEKGSGFTKEVFSLLKRSSLNFIGNVEGHDLFEKHVDVVVCDGFTGNVVLKSCEATANAMFKWLRMELKRSPLRICGALLAKGAFQAVKERANYETYGGSPLLGVNGICIISHGSSSALAIRNAIRVAADSIAQRVNPHIEEEIERHLALHA